MDNDTQRSYAEISSWKNTQEDAEATETSLERSLVLKRNIDEEMNKIAELQSVSVRGMCMEEQRRVNGTIHQRNLLLERKVDELMRLVEMFQSTPLREIEEQGRELKKIQGINTHLEKKFHELTRKVHTLEVMPLNHLCEKQHKLALAELSERNAVLVRNLNELKQRVESLEFPSPSNLDGIQQNSVAYDNDLTLVYIIIFLVSVIIGILL